MFTPEVSRLDKLKEAAEKAALATGEEELAKALQKVTDAFAECVGELVLAATPTALVKNVEAHKIITIPLEMCGVEPRTLACFKFNGNLSFLPSTLQKTRDKSPEQRKALLGSILALQELMTNGPSKLNTI